MGHDHRHRLSMAYMNPLRGTIQYEIRKEFGGLLPICGWLLAFYTTA